MLPSLPSCVLRVLILLYDLSNINNLPKLSSSSFPFAIDTTKVDGDAPLHTKYLVSYHQKSGRHLR